PPLGHCVPHRALLIFSALAASTQLSHTHTHTHTQSHSHTDTHTHTHRHRHTHTDTHTHTHTYTHTHTHSLLYEPLLRWHLQHAAHLQPGTAHFLLAGAVGALGLALLARRHRQAHH